MSNGFLMIDGFDGASTANGDGTLYWNLLPYGMRDTTFKRNGTHGIGVTDGYGHDNGASKKWKASSYIFSSPVPHLIIGFALRATVEVSLSEMRLLELIAPDAGPRVRIGLTGNRTFWVKSGNSEYDVENQGVSAYSSYALETDQWYYIEISVAADLITGLGRLIIQVNGPPGTPGSDTTSKIIDVSGHRLIRLASGGGGYPVIPADGGYAGFHMGILYCPDNATDSIAIDDIYVRDGSLGGWVGDSKVVSIALESDRSVGFTPSTGVDNFAMVDEIAPDDDVTYNESTINAQDVFEVADQVIGGFIHCVQLASRVRKTDTAPQYIESLIELSGITTYVGPRYLATSYESRPPDIFSDAPGKTGWTQADINAMGVGYRLTIPTP